jgi:hypothetical protein
MKTNLTCHGVHTGARRSLRLAAATALACLATLSAGVAGATTVTEGTGFLSTYTGPTPAPDLDAISATALFNSQSIFLSATMAGAIGTTPEGIYIWGVNRGAGTELLFHPSTITDTTVPVGEGVPFDAFIFLNNQGFGRVVLLGPGPDPHPIGATDLAPGAVTIDGATISVNVPRALLPSTGFEVADYGYNIWPRFNDITGNFRVTDFLPDASNFLGSATPEPASWALMIGGFGLAGATLRRRRRLAALA